MKYFSVSNFKSFAKKQHIPIKPITLIYGANSTGKSSVIQSFLLLNNILKTGQCDVETIETYWDSIDIGGFKQYMHKHKYQKQIEFMFEFDRKDKLELKIIIGAETDDFDNLLNKPSSIHSFEFISDGKTIVEFTKDYSAFTRNQFKITDFKMAYYEAYSSVESAVSYDGYEIDEALIRDLTFDFEKFVSGHSVNDFNLKLCGDCFRGLDYDIESQLPPKFIELLCDLFIEMWQPLWEDNREGVMNNSIRALNYIGPLRDVPPRVISNEQNNNSTDHTWSILLKDEYVRNKVNQWLGDKKLMDTTYEFKIENKINPEPLLANFLDLLARVDITSGYVPEELEHILQVETDYDENDSADYHLSTDGYNSENSEDLINNILKKQKNIDMYSKLVLLDHRAGIPVSLRDVGVGISQVLPVLVNAYSPEANVIAIEQPEIHLHPKLQSELADVFIETALGDEKKTYLIETHSEHLLLRIMRRIRETSNGELDDHLTEITADDVQILFVMPNPNGEGSVVKKIALRNNGELKSRWPGGFFEESFNEMF